MHPKAVSRSVSSLRKARWPGSISRASASLSLVLERRFPSVASFPSRSTRFHSTTGVFGRLVNVSTHLDHGVSRRWRAQFPAVGSCHHVGLVLRFRGSVRASCEASNPSGRLPGDTILALSPPRRAHVRRGAAGSRHRHGDRRWRRSNGAISWRIPPTPEIRRRSQGQGPRYRLEWERYRWEGRGRLRSGIEGGDVPGEGSGWKRTVQMDGSMGGGGMAEGAFDAWRRTHEEVQVKKRGEEMAFLAPHGSTVCSARRPSVQDDAPPATETPRESLVRVESHGGTEPRATGRGSRQRAGFPGPSEGRSCLPGFQASSLHRSCASLSTFPRPHGSCPPFPPPSPILRSSSPRNAWSQFLLFGIFPIISTWGIEGEVGTKFACVSVPCTCDDARRRRFGVGRASSRFFPPTRRHDASSRVSRSSIPPGRGIRHDRGPGGSHAVPVGAPNRHHAGRSVGGASARRERVFGRARFGMEGRCDRRRDLQAGEAAA
eukprot:scaffold1708_cov322-Pavlova_lutheri.AAC.20